MFEKSYFISYYYTDKQNCQGFGNCPDFRWKGKIRPEHITIIENRLKQIIKADSIAIINIIKN